MKKIAILGSTGSIGTQSLEVIRSQPDMEATVLAAGSNVELLEKQIREFHPKLVCVYKEDAAKLLKQAVSDLDVTIVSGMDGLIEAAAFPETQIVVTAVVGMIGIRPTIAAIKAGKDIALANKETLVTAGHLIIPMIKQYGVRLLPVDSEHSAIFQSLMGSSPEGSTGHKIDKILLTASGGPFRGWTKEQMKNIRPEDALKHPNWVMGRKITIVKQSAQTILVDVENVEEKDFTDLVVEYTGKVADGYVAGLSSMSTDEVTVKAPTSIIDKIKKVAVRCSLDGTTTNISKKCPVILYDKNDKEIKSDEIELSDKKIRVNVNVLRAKQVPISTINKDELGKPADGYVVDDVILSSDSITVYGSEESLDSIESLDIQDDIDVSDAKGDVTQNIDVTGKLPKGLSVSGESTITVKVLIKKLITRTFEYDASEVSLNDLSSNLDVQLVTKKVKVTLQGEVEVISQLTKDDIAISADLGKVKEGTTTVHVDVAVPDNTTLMNNVTIKIKAKAK